jgi:[Skp1-protein]-hydroxyproline N-acetylglucosaminyltransferase
MFNIPVRNDNSIFVSIAAYRDKDCANTILSCFEKAQNPNNIFIGICQQNKKEDQDCFFNELQQKLQKYKNNIRIIRIPFYEAKGPTYARYLCSTLWNGENYYLQIDSHIRFAKNWDALAIDMINKIKTTTSSQKPVLSYYSKIIEDSEKDNITTVPRICKAFFNDRGMISFLGAEEVPISDMPYQTPYVAAGFIFVNSSFLYELPFDPYLPNLFVGEEMLLSIRFWTNGWDIYSPSKNIVFHKYTRKDEPHVWDDNKFDDLDAFAKVKNLIGLSTEPVPEILNKQLEEYGLGKTRKLEDYYKFANIDIVNKKVNSNFCRQNNVDDKVEKFIELLIPRKDYEKFEQTIPKQNKDIPYKFILGFLLLLIFIYIYCYYKY